MKRILTGITTTGIPHLGNYAGAIRPAIQASLQPNTQSFFFLADYHALIKCDEPARVAQSRLEIASSWLAAGLDPDHVTLYRQSDIPEIQELNWILSCVTAKGLMNRAHAYKAAVDQNNKLEHDVDDGISMGLYSYPVLMAADILLFNANTVPVGYDQIQHIQMARDIAQRFNHVYGQHFDLPEAQVSTVADVLPGLDGRKMSKSYNNTIPLFAGGSKALKKNVMRIVTDSLLPGEPKDALNSNVYKIYRAFSTDDEAQAFKDSLDNGLGWGDAKKDLVALLERELSPMRDKYEYYMAAPSKVRDILLAGASRARNLVSERVQKIREAVGLYDI